MIYTTIFIENGRVINFRSFSDYSSAKNRLEMLLSRLQKEYKEWEGYNAEEVEALKLMDAEDVEDGFYFQFLFSGERKQIEVVFLSGDLD